MTVMVLGTGGLIGDAIAQGLMAADVPTLCVSRNSRGPAGIKTVAGDRRDPQLIASLVAHFEITCIIDVIAYTEAGSLPLFGTLAPCLERYVLISSCDVYQNYGRLHRLDPSAADIGLLDENAPLRASRYPYRGAIMRAPNDPDAWMDHYDKLPLENAVRASFDKWTILRLPMVYGPGDRQHRFRWIIQPLRAGIDELRVPANWLNWVSTYGFSMNIGAAVASAACHPATIKRTFNVTDCSPMSHRQWIERFSSRIGWTGNIRADDDPQSPFAQRLASLDLTVPLALDGSALRSIIPGIPVVDLDTALDATIESETLSL
jgi:nucleoside-diphosphate-sugar epimerase